MRRAIFLVILALFVIAGVVFGALNNDVVEFDLVFTHVQVPKGAAALAALLVGWLLGGLVAWFGPDGSRHARRHSAGQMDHHEGP